MLYSFNFFLHYIIAKLDKVLCIILYMPSFGNCEIVKLQFTWFEKMNRSSRALPKHSWKTIIQVRITLALSVEFDNETEINLIEHQRKLCLDFGEFSSNKDRSD